MTTEPPGQGRTVLVVLHGEEVGGASLSVLRIAPHLASLGWRLVFWAPRPSDLFDEVSSRGLPVHGEPRPLAGYSWAAMRISPGVMGRVARAPGYFAGLRRTIRATRPALVHCNSMYTLDEAVLARACGAPVVFHVHEMVGDSAKHRIARRLLHAVGNGVVGVSQAGRRALSAPGHPARLVHECVAAPSSVPDRSKRTEPTRVGMIGVIARRKGPDLFVAAARLVREVTDQVEFHLAGAATDPLDRDWAERVLADARATGIEHVERAAVSDALAEWDIFVLPSRVDPFPIVVLEAMAAGLPVVGTRVDGIAEQLRGGTGLLVDAEDPQALAHAILSLHGDSALRHRLGAAGRRRVTEHFSLDRQAAGLSDAYRASLGEL